MPRLYLITCFFLVSFVSFAQVKTKKLIEFADQQYKKGDYVYAIDYYQQALTQDSNSIELLWKFAEVQRAYKNYVAAEEYYAKVFARDNAKLYPASALYLGLMQKQNAKYTKAFETFKLAKRKYENDKNSYLYKKAVQEIDATAWAIKNYSDTLKPLESLPNTVNSSDAEFGHTIRDNQLIFSSLRADSVNSNEEVYGKNYKTRLYKSKIENGEFKQNERIDSLVFEKLNSGNGTFSIDGSRFYFSLCEDEGYNYKCRILVSNYANGSWSKIDTLGKEINEVGKNSTMPFIAKMNGKEVLFFASDKKGSKGGLDIWSADVNDSKIENVQNVSAINTMDNELSPWYDSTNNRLYFSSSWHYGFGGQDVFYSDFPFSKVENVGLPINSPANDQYFFKHNDTSYVSSNRIGTRYTKNPTCCSDIFAQYPIITKPIENSFVSSDSLNDVALILKKKLPVRLYFRNDEPDPDSWATSTKQDYMETYLLYKENYTLYKQEVGKGLNTSEAQKKQNELEQFFINDVDKGAQDLKEFTELLTKELSLGSKVTVILKGFASPLAKTNYNVNLTKRRISSLVNYFNDYNHGELNHYLNGSAQNGGKLSFEYIPFGEFSADQTTSDDFYNQKESVYSREAGIERKLHIEEVIIEKSKEEFPISAKEYVFNAGVKQKGDRISGRFVLENHSNFPTELYIENKEVDLIFSSDKLIIEAKSTLVIPFQLNTYQLKGFNRKSFQIKVNGFENSLELFITAEIK